MDDLLLPPFLEECLSGYRYGRWVGTNDPFAPQLTIDMGPTIPELKKCQHVARSLLFSVSMRTADMTETDPDEVVGSIEISNIEIFEERYDDVHFIGQTALNCSADFLRNVSVWVWQYDGQQGAADFYVS